MIDLTKLLSEVTGQQDTENRIEVSAQFDALRAFTVDTRAEVQVLARKVENLTAIVDKIADSLILIADNSLKLTKLID